MNRSLSPDDLLEVRRTLNKNSVMTSAEVVVNIDLRSINDALTEENGDRVALPINEIPAGFYTASVFEYAVNGVWTWLDLMPFLLPFEHLTQLPPADLLAQLQQADYYEDYFHRNKHACILTAFDKHRLRLRCLADLANARSRLDYATNPAGSQGERADSDLFGLHGERHEVTLTYLDVSLLSGVSVRSIRNLVSGARKPFRPIKRGRDAVFNPQEIADWLESRDDYKKTKLVERDEHQRIAEAGVGPLFASQFLEFPNDD